MNLSVLIVGVPTSSEAFKGRVAYKVTVVKQLTTKAMEYIAIIYICSHCYVFLSDLSSKINILENLQLNLPVAIVLLLSFLERCCCSSLHLYRKAWLAFTAVFASIQYFKTYGGWITRVATLYIIDQDLHLLR